MDSGLTLRILFRCRDDNGQHHSGLLLRQVWGEPTNSGDHRGVFRDGEFLLAADGRVGFRRNGEEVRCSREIVGSVGGADGGGFAVRFAGAS